MKTVYTFLRPNDLAPVVNKSSIKFKFVILLIHDKIN